MKFNKKQLICFLPELQGLDFVWQHLRVIWINCIFAAHLHFFEWAPFHFDCVFSRKKSCIPSLCRFCRFTWSKLGAVLRLKAPGLMRTWHCCRFFPASRPLGFMWAHLSSIWVSLSPFEGPQYHSIGFIWALLMQEVYTPLSANKVHSIQLKTILFGFDVWGHTFVGGERESVNLESFFFLVKSDFWLQSFFSWKVGFSVSDASEFVEIRYGDWRWGDMDGGLGDGPCGGPIGWVHLRPSFRCKGNRPNHRQIRRRNGSPTFKGIKEEPSAVTP